MRAVIIVAIVIGCVLLAEAKPPRGKGRRGKPKNLPLCQVIFPGEDPVDYECKAPRVESGETPVAVGCEAEAFTFPVNGGDAQVFLCDKPPKPEEEDDGDDSDGKKCGPKELCKLESQDGAGAERPCSEGTTCQARADGEQQTINGVNVTPFFCVPPAEEEPADP